MPLLSAAASAAAGSATFCSCTPTLEGHPFFCKPRSQPCSLTLRSSRKLFQGRNATVVKSMQRSVIRRSRPDAAEEVRMVAVEDEAVPVEGVIKVDKVEAKPARPSWRRAFTLASGDLLALLAFAAIGRTNHGMSATDWEVVRTADPFIAGWALAAYLLGGYGPEGQGLYGLRVAATSAAKSWAVGIPLGLVIRSLSTGHLPPLAFILVSMGSILVIMVSWRTAFTFIFPNEDQTRKKDVVAKQGSVFELFELLTSLVRRW